MKACFFLQRRFALIGHQMAILLKEKYGIKEFCALVNLRSSAKYLTFQKDIYYSKLILEEDVYIDAAKEKIDLAFLKAFEKEYGMPNAWPYILLDRVIRFNLLRRLYPSDTSIYSHEEMLKMFQAMAKKIISFLETEKPDFVFFSAISNLASLLLYQVAQKKNIKTLFICDPRLESRYALTNRYDAYGMIYRSFEDVKNNPNGPENARVIEQAKKFLESFQSRPTYYIKSSAAMSFFNVTPTSRLYPFRFLAPARLVKSIHWWFKNYWNYFRNVNNDRNDYTIIKPWWEDWDKIVKKIRLIRGYGDLYDQPIMGEEYAYFALHTEPEYLPTLVAPFYKDQIWLIIQVARSLPVHMKLYVKDHPQMIGLRTRAYYKAIKKIPNVRLINPAVSSFELTQKSKLSVTITGTSAWEALLLKKPAIIFGNVFYEKLSGVKLCRNIYDLPYMIREQLDRFKYNHDEIINFLAALYKESVPLDLAYIWNIEGGSNAEKTKAALAPFVDLLAKKLKV